MRNESEFFVVADVGRVSFSFETVTAKTNQTRRYCSRKFKPPGSGTFGISGWGCAAGTMEPLAYTRASSAEFC